MPDKPRGASSRAETRVPARERPAKDDVPSGPRYQGVVHHHGRVTVETHATAQEAHDWAEAYARDVAGDYEVQVVE